MPENQGRLRLRQLLLDGKLEFNGFPDSVPGGMEPAKIRRLALAQAVERNLTLAQLSDAWVLT
ncbi:MAG: hypothetical protein IPN71_16345 [Fibrobacteres bacterium]|nr:hypothetical protein [Fibrobacterota bacterium]